MTRPVLLLLLLLSIPGLAEADTTASLYPTADGGLESANWRDTASVACNTTNCYDEVDETSGATCTTTPSDGATTIILIWGGYAGTQTFDIDESSIPNDSTVTSAIVYVCALSGSPGRALGTNFCVNGACTDSATQTTTASYADYNYTIDFPDDTKTGADDYEIGVVTAAAGAATHKVSAMKVVITYTPSAAARRNMVIF